MLSQAGSTFSTGCQIDQIDASVAPPRLTTRGRPGSRERRQSRPGRFSGIQSPLSMASRSEGARCCPDSSRWVTSISSSAGTEFQMVTRSPAISRVQLWGARMAEGAGRTTGGPDGVAAVLEFAGQNPHFFVPFSMAAAKAVADRARGIPGCPVVTGMGGNGVRVAARVSGAGDRWFTAPAPLARPKLFPGFTTADVQPAMGDSLIVEAVGLGACALSAAPAICSYIGGTPAEAARLVGRLRRVTAATSTRFLIPYEGFQGTPLGIDAIRVSGTKIAPVSNTGLAHRQAGIGQVGAGLTWLPLAPFEAAARALREEHRDAG